MQFLDTPTARASNIGTLSGRYGSCANASDTGYGKSWRGMPGREPAARWLRDSALLQHDHPKVRLLGMRLTQLKSSNREKAIACFEYVRGLDFSCSTDAGRATSVEVLRAGTGDGFGKSTLFIALLRSIGIPARLRVVSLRAAYLRGFAGVEDGVVEHAFTEVLIGGEWFGVDSYIVDPRLRLRARTQLLLEGRTAGYGIHLKGQVAWDARSSSFSQFSGDEPAGLPMLDLGAYDDVRQFQAAMAPDLLSEWTRRKPWSIAAVMANRRVEKLRGPDKIARAGDAHIARRA